MAYLKANDTETPLLNEGRGQVGESACSLEVKTIFGLFPINHVQFLHLKIAELLCSDYSEVDWRCNVTIAKF